jgi:hypothetical protein
MRYSQHMSKFLKPDIYWLAKLLGHSKIVNKQQPKNQKVVVVLYESQSGTKIS